MTRSGSPNLAIPSVIALTKPSFASTAQDIQTRAISAAARQASSSDKYQSGFFFTTRQIDPIAIEI